MYKLLSLRQRQHELLDHYQERFLSSVSAVERKWGPLVPSAIASKSESEKTEERNKFLAMLFLSGARHKYKDARTSRHNCSTNSIESGVAVEMGPNAALLPHFDRFRRLESPDLASRAPTAPEGFHRRRTVHRDVAAHGHLLGAEREHLR